MRALDRIAMSILAVLTALFVVAPAASAATPSTDTAPTTGDASIQAVANLGGVDLLGYCQAIGYVGVRDGGGATGWRCIAADQSEHSISVEDACNFQFINLVIDGFVLFADSTGGAGGWRCGTNALRYTPLGGMDLANYCRSIGYTNSVLIERNVAGWRCQSGNTLAKIDLHAACRFSNPALAAAGYSLAATYGSFGDAFGIKCAALRNF
jgi:hypothetical protein